MDPLRPVAAVRCPSGAGGEGGAPSCLELRCGEFTMGSYTLVYFSSFVLPETDGSGARAGRGPGPGAGRRSGRGTR